MLKSIDSLLGKQRELMYWGREEREEGLPYTGVLKNIK